jgi:hypothetical protein
MFYLRDFLIGINVKLCNKQYKSGIQCDFTHVNLILKLNVKKYVTT